MIDAHVHFWDGRLDWMTEEMACSSPDPAWLLRDDVQRGVAAVQAAGLAYDLLVHVSCKVSGSSPRPAGPAGSRTTSSRTFRVWSSGSAPSGCFFGSDWPVCLLAASYDEVVAACEHALGDLAPLGRTAAQVYGLPCAPSSQTRT